MEVLPHEPQARRRGRGQALHDSTTDNLLSAFRASPLPHCGIENVPSLCTIRYPQKRAPRCRTRHSSFVPNLVLPTIYHSKDADRQVLFSLYMLVVREFEGM